MSDARRSVLASIRQHLARDGKGGPPLDPAFGPLPSVEPEVPVALVAQFAERLAAAGGTCHRATTDGLAEVVRGILTDRGARRVALSDAALLQGLPDGLAAAGLEVLAADADRTALLACDAGVTCAQRGIAQTGTLVLDGGAERHRLRSLLPPLHLAVLPVSTLVATMGEALALLPRPLSAAVTFVTGPSRTADIELQLVVGVHGPRELHVVLVG